MPRQSHPPFAYRRPAELSGTRPRHPVVIIGAGPVGLAAAVDLALHGVRCVVLDDNDVVSVGSRAICWAKRTLEIFHRLGIGQRMVDKGVTWKVGRLFHRDREIYSFDLLPEAGHRMPAFINLQQYYVEQHLVERCGDFPDLIDLRWRNRVSAIQQTGADRGAFPSPPRGEGGSAQSGEPGGEAPSGQAKSPALALPAGRGGNATTDFGSSDAEPCGASLTVETPDGAYEMEADWVIACDGARSPTRGLMGLDFAGRVFEERFLIADIAMEADFPSERWFWFEPPFHEGRSALLHKQPDDIYRIDLQLGWDTDPEEEKKPENVIPRIRAMVGDRPFELDWVSIYTFQCRRLERFVHGRVIFAGDSAHVVSPFGARGGNGGIQDVDNLVWKLAAVIRGEAPPSLLASYDEERIHAADENIRNSSRSTSFMTPKSEAERQFRGAAIALAAEHSFARLFVNSGRLSLPASYGGMSLQGAAGGSRLAPGMPCPDAPLLDEAGDASFLLDHLGGAFRLLAIGDAGPAQAAATPHGLPLVRIGAGGFTDRDGLARERYGEGVFLVRPDQHIAAVLDAADEAGLAAALAQAHGHRAPNQNHAGRDNSGRQEQAA